MTDAPCLDQLVTQYLAAQNQLRDFHNAQPMMSDYDYYRIAEEDINRMTNIELLEVLSQTLRWYREGGDIGL